MVDAIPRTSNAATFKASSSSLTLLIFFVIYRRLSCCLVNNQYLLADCLPIVMSGSDLVFALALILAA